MTDRRAAAPLRTIEIDLQRGRPALFPAAESWRMQMGPAAVAVLPLLACCERAAPKPISRDYKGDKPTPRPADSGDTTGRPTGRDDTPAHMVPVPVPVPRSGPPRPPVSRGLGPTHNGRDTDTDIHT